MNLTDSRKSALMEHVFHAAESGILVLDREFTILLANRSMEERFGNGRSLTGQKCFEALHSRSQTCTGCPCLRTLEKDEPHSQVVRSSTQDGSDWVELSAYPCRDEAGNIIGVIEFSIDITKRKLLEEQLRNESVLAHMLLDQSRDGILIVDLEGKVNEFNEQFATSLGYTGDELRNMYLWDIDAEWDSEERSLEVLQRAAVSNDQFESMHRRKDGTLMPVEVHTSAFVSRGEKLVLFVCRDVSEKQEMQRHIERISIRDSLTGLFNRRYVLERLEEFRSEYSRLGAHFCITILDIDRFAFVNDVHGHRAGDLVLERFARMLSSAVRPYDLVGRYGGEDFIIVSRNATARQTEAMIQRLMKTVRDKDFVFEGHRIRFTFSCGLAHSSEFARETLSIQHMLTRAEERLCQAKVDGRDRCTGAQV